MSRKPKTITDRVSRPLPVAILVLFDVCCLTVALLTSYYLRIGSTLLPYYATTDPALYLHTLLWVLPFWIASFAFEGLYGANALGEGPQEYCAVFKACAIGILAVMVVDYWQRNHPLSRGVLLLTLAFSVVLTSGMRFIGRRVMRRLHLKGRVKTNVLVVGANEHARAVARQLLRNRQAGLVPSGFLDDHLPVGSEILPGIPVVGSPADLSRVAGEIGTTTAIVIPEALAWESWHDLLRDVVEGCNGINVWVSPGMYDRLVMSRTVCRRAGISMIEFKDQWLSGADSALKNIFDYGVGLILLGPIAAVSLLIVAARLLTARGPVLRRDLGIGIHGRFFYRYHFRTDSANGGRTYLGETLARYGLDRLPELINVFRGEMSVVGPRPAFTVHTLQDRLAPVLRMKPGIIGPWVESASDFDEMDEHALTYIRDWTVWTDLRILLKMFAILKRRRPRHELDSFRLREHRPMTSVKATVAQSRAPIQATSTTQYTGVANS